MSDTKRRLLIAVSVGLVTSSILFVASYTAPRSEAFDLMFYWSQALGFWLTMVLRGVDSATKADFALIAIPTNGFVYALVFFIADSLRRRVLK